MTIRYVSRFRSRFTVSIGAVLFSLAGLRDFEHYAFAWMDSGFYRPIIKLASAHLLDCELGERFRSRFTVSIGAVLFSLAGLRDFEHYAFAWMDSGFYRPIIK